MVFFTLHIFACMFHYITLLDDRNSWVEASGIVNEGSQIDRCAPLADLHAAVLQLGDLRDLGILGIWELILMLVSCTERPIRRPLNSTLLFESSAEHAPADM